MDEDKGLPGLDKLPLPLPVVITEDQKPLPVTIADKEPKPVPVPPPTGGGVEHKLPSVTTPEEDRSTASQRRVNLIWETTQSAIAVAVTIATLLVSSILATRIDSGSDRAAFLLLSNAFFLVSGFYFGRTNHTRTGGVQSTKER